MDSHERSVSPDVRCLQHIGAHNRTAPKAVRATSRYVWKWRGANNAGGKRRARFPQSFFYTLF